MLVFVLLMPWSYKTGVVFFSCKQTMCDGT